MIKLPSYCERFNYDCNHPIREYLDCESPTYDEDKPGNQSFYYGNCNPEDHLLHPRPIDDGELPNTSQIKES